MERHLGCRGFGRFRAGRERLPAAPFAKPRRLHPVSSQLRTRRHLMDEHFIGFDLGGTKMLAGLVGTDHQVATKVKRKSLTQDGAETVYSDIVATLHDVLR